MGWIVIGDSTGGWPARHDVIRLACSFRRD